MIVTHKIEMDLLKGGATPWIKAVQDDKYSRNMELSLFSDGEAWTVPAGATGIVHYMKPDGTGGSYDVLPDGTAACTAAENTLTVALAPQVCTVAGIVQLAVSLVKGLAELHTFPVLINVQPNPEMNGSSETYYNLSGVLPYAGWAPNMYLGTDAGGNVVAKAASGGSGSDSNGGSGLWYGTTSTGINTAEKVVTTVTGDFKLVKGARLGVKFLTNTVNCNSLIVDGTAQTYIRSINDEAGNADSSLPIVWHNLGQVQWFTYDGEYFIMDDSIRATAANNLCGKVAVSDSVSSTGNTVASSTAVKTAYDKAVEAWNAVSDLDAAIATAIGSGVVA